MIFHTIAIKFIFLPVAFMAARTINAYVRAKMYCVIRVRLIMRSMKIIKTVKMPLIAAPFQNKDFRFDHDLTFFNIIVKRINALCINVISLFDFFRSSFRSVSLR